MKERPVIIVAGKMPNMQSWPTYEEEKCRRVLEELSLLADTLHRPGDESNKGWPTKQEEINSHLFNVVRMVLILTNTSCGQRPVRSEDISCLVDEGYAGFEKIREKFLE